MDEEQQKNDNLNLSPDELKAEEEAMAEVKSEELKSQLAEEFNIVPEDEPELFEKLMSRETNHREKLSKAIQQKRNWRDKVNTPVKPKENPEDNKDTKEKPLTAEEFERRLDERFNKAELRDLDLSEDIQTEINDLAKLKGISIRESAKHPYIVSRIEESDAEIRLNNGTPRRSNQGGSGTNVGASQGLDYTQFDHSTKEGREKWEKAKAVRKAAREA